MAEVTQLDAGVQSLLANIQSTQQCTLPVHFSCLAKNNPFLTWLQSSDNQDVLSKESYEFRLKLVT